MFNLVNAQQPAASYPSSAQILQLISFDLCIGLRVWGQSIFLDIAEETSLFDKTFFLDTWFASCWKYNSKRNTRNPLSIDSKAVMENRRPVVQCNKLEEMFEKHQ